MELHKRSTSGCLDSLLGFPPPFLQTVKNQKLDGGKAWERGYKNGSTFEHSTVSNSPRLLTSPHLKTFQIESKANSCSSIGDLVPDKFFMQGLRPHQKKGQNAFTGKAKAKS